MSMKSTLFNLASLPISLILICTASSVLAVEKDFISPRDAVQIARDSALVDDSVDAWHELTTDAVQRTYYVVDFVKCDSDDATCFFKKRLLVNPQTGVIEDNPNVLREWSAGFGDVPEQFDPYTKAERRRPINRPMITKLAAAQEARQFLKLGEKFDTWVELRHDRLGTSRYAVDFVEEKQKSNFYWKARVVVNPFTGEIESDPSIQKSFGADGKSKPKDLNIAGNGLILTPMQIKMNLYLAWWGFSILVLIALGFKFSHRLAKWTVIDKIFCFFTVLLCMLTGLIYTMIPEHPWYAITCLSTVIICLTMWLMILEQKRLFGIYEEQDLQPISPEKLHRFDSVGGMEEVKQELKQTLGRMMRFSDLARGQNISFNGILLYGPPGTGKTYLAKACGGEFGLKFLNVKISDMTSSLFGGSARKIDNAFKKAIKSAPCILFLDELDSLGSSRAGDPQMENTRITNHLLHWIEEVRSKGKNVFIFAASNRKEDLDEALIRSGRFDKHIFISLPDTEARKKILEACVKRRGQKNDLDLVNLSLRTDGLSAANIDAVVNRAYLKSLNVDKVSDLQLTNEILIESINEFRSKRKNVISEKTWDELILQKEVKDEIQRLIKVVETPEVVKNLGINPPKGVLLYGPPGTGKTTIAKIIAHEAKASFFAISQSDIYSKWHGESQQNVRKIFQEARNVRPSVIFIDEIEAIMGKRDSSLNNKHGDQIASMILQEIDGMDDSSNVFVIGATNCPDAVDTALLRGGRLSIQIEIPLPSPEQQKQLFQLFLSKVNLDPSVDFDDLIGMIEGYSGADIKDLCDRVIIDSYDSLKGEKVTIDQESLLLAIKAYTRHSGVYRVPDYMKKSRLGF